MISVVPPDWRFVFIGSNLSVISVGRAYATKHQQVIGKLDLMVLPEPWEIATKEKVFRLLTDSRFYDEFLPGVEWLLKFEADSIMCANSEESLNDWLDWHWAGAPRTPDDRFSGNGGLSLRRVSAIKRVLSFQARYNDTEAEDEWFGKRMYILPGYKVASGNDGVLTVEDVYKADPIGFHVRDGGKQLADAVWKNPLQRKAIFDYCPELSMIMDMKLERERCAGDDKEGLIHPTEEEKAAEAAKKAAEAAKAADEARKKALEEAKKKASAAASAASAAAAAKTANASSTVVPAAVTPATLPVQSITSSAVEAEETLFVATEPHAEAAGAAGKTTTNETVKEDEAPE
jgi:sRNA-binding protein